MCQGRRHLRRLQASIPLEQKGVGVRILNLGMDIQTPTGKLMLTVLGAIAQFERDMMLERQREGIDKAKSEGPSSSCTKTRQQEK